MCGVAGFFPRTGVRAEASSQNLERLLGLLHHRGPDNARTWIAPEGRVALGHARLSIIDLTESGSQPMHSRSGRFTLALNGEIYNYHEIREDLSRQGCRFKGESDTEVFVEAVSEWGLREAVARTIGMFAFLLWDQARGTLSLVRDRIGKKPLYMAETPEGRWVASEISALAQVIESVGEVDHEAVHHFLSLGFIPGVRTIYQGIREVPPASILTWSVSSDDLLDRYWIVPNGPGEEVDPTEALESQVDNVLRSAVALRLRADVPVGCYLSGGIDSGLLAAIASQESSERLRTFTVRFGEGSDDEGPLARLVADRYGTDHQEIWIEEEVPDLVQRVASAFGEPFGDASAVPSYAVAEAAAREVRVVLNGEGADELFGGYRRHVAAWSWEHLGGPLQGVLRIIGRAATGRWSGGSRGGRTKTAFVGRFLKGASSSASIGAQYIDWTREGFIEEEKAFLYRDGMSPCQTTAAAVEGAREWPEDVGFLRDFMGLDVTVTLRDCLLVKVDITSMAHSLEARSPFLDHRLIELAQATDRRVLLPWGRRKHVLKTLARKYLPDKLLTQPKRGFEVPLSRWLENELSEMLDDLVFSGLGIIGDLFHIERIRTLRDGAKDLERWGTNSRRHKLIWLLLSLALWDRSRGAM